MAYPGISLTEYSINTRPLAHCVNLTWCASGLLFLSISEERETLSRLFVTAPTNHRQHPGRTWAPLLAYAGQFIVCYIRSVVDAMNISQEENSEASESAGGLWIETPCVLCGERGADSERAGRDRY